MSSPNNPTRKLNHLEEGMVVHGRIRSVHQKQAWGHIISESYNGDILWNFEDICVKELGERNAHLLESLQIESGISTQANSSPSGGDSAKDDNNTLKIEGQNTLNNKSESANGAIIPKSQKLKDLEEALKKVVPEKLKKDDVVIFELAFRDTKDINSNKNRTYSTISNITASPTSKGALSPNASFLGANSSCGTGLIVCARNIRKAKNMEEINELDKSNAKLKDNLNSLAGEKYEKPEEKNTSSSSSNDGGEDSTKHSLLKNSNLTDQPIAYCINPAAKITNLDQEAATKISKRKDSKDDDEIKNYNDSEIFEKKTLEANLIKDASDPLGSNVAGGSSGSSFNPKSRTENSKNTDPSKNQLQQLSMLINDEDDENNENNQSQNRSSLAGATADTVPSNLSAFADPNNPSHLNMYVANANRAKREQELRENGDQSKQQTKAEKAEREKQKKLENWEKAQNRREEAARDRERIMNKTGYAPNANGTSNMQNVPNQQNVNNEQNSTQNDQDNQNNQNNQAPVPNNTKILLEPIGTFKFFSLEALADAVAGYERKEQPKMPDIVKRDANGTMISKEPRSYIKPPPHKSASFKTFKHDPNETSRQVNRGQK